jgi:RNA polymerase primary sigma factor
MEVKKDVDILIKEVAACNTLTAEEDFALTKAVQDKGTDCDEMKKLHEVYDRFVVSIAKQYLDKGLSLEELVEVGKSGLEKAKACREALLRYCELDTWAMVKVWEKLKEVVE